MPSAALAATVAAAGAGTAEPAAALQDALAQAMAPIAEPGEAGPHIVRVQLFVQALGRRLQETAPYAQDWTAETLQALVRAAALHDIGNSVVPDRILLKPGVLTAQEFEVVRLHPQAGCDIITQIQRRAGGSTPFLSFAREITLGHHERWDGSGYPQGLAREAIPAAARLVAIADAYDALTSDRVYRSGVPHDKAARQIFQQRGAQFAPDMVDAFIEVQFAFRDIAQQHADGEHDLQRQIDYLAKAIAENP